MTGSARLLPLDHPAWLVLLLLGVIYGLYTSRGSSTGRVEEALRDLAEEQRKRAGGRLHLSHAVRGNPMVVEARTNGGRARPVREIVEEFQEKLACGQVPRAVVLGLSGAGKSTMAALIVHLVLTSPRKDTDRVPVLFRLASWSPDDEEFTDWLSGQLAQDHPRLLRRYPRSVLGELVTDRRVFVLLDGLDELKEEQRPKALAKIDKWLDDYSDETPFVLTCRTEDRFPDLGESGRVLGTVPRINLEPVRPGKGMDYLGDRQVWEPLLRRRAAEDRKGPLAALLEQPLMLFLTREVGLAPGGSAGSPVVEQLGDRDAHPTTEKLEELLLKAFIPTMYENDQKHHSGRRPWPAPAAGRWLAFLARRLTEHGRNDFGWHGLAELAPGRGRVPPVVLGAAAGVVAAVASRLVGLPAGWWWGLAAGAGFATLLWLLERRALCVPASPGDSRQFHRAVADGLGIGMSGGLVVGLPGAFFARFLSAGPATLLLGALLGIVAGAAPRRSDARSAGTGLLTGIVAGPVAWLVAALTCGFPQGAQVGYADELPGGAAIGALQAWRSALGFGLADQLWTAVAFSLVVGVLAGVVVELGRGWPGGWVIARRQSPERVPSGHVMVPLAAAGVGALAGVAAGAVLLGGHGAAGGAAVGAGFAAAYAVVALRGRRDESTERAEVFTSLLVSLHVRVRLGLAGGIAGGLAGGLVFPEQYRYLGGSRISAVFAGGADGLQAGFVFGLLAGVAFGLRTGLFERIRQLGADGDADERVRHQRVIPFAVWATIGACTGALMGVALDTALGAHIRRDADVVVGTYAAAGLVLGLAVAVAIRVERNYDRFGHHSTLRTACHSALAAAGLVAAAAGVGTWLVTNPTFGVTAFVMAGTLVLGSSPWGRFVVTRTRLAATRRLPWRLDRFLRDALDLGVLHQAGSGHQFRHARLRDAVAAPPSRGGGPRRVSTPLAVAAAAVVTLSVMVLGATRPPPDTTAYSEFRTTVSTITAVGRGGGLSSWDGSPVPLDFARGYAVETRFVLYGRGQAGVYLPGIAYATASCAGQYSFTEPSAPYPVIRTGYLEQLDGGYGCTIDLIAHVRDRTARIFANGVHIHDLTFNRTPNQRLPAPSLVSIDSPRTLSLDATLWSLDDPPTA
ncbi:NACHT domain-containing protein [Actinophytocola oryzae]|uniref:NACHT domain-containing protein n=1 Tax=Actinophytocola oryzae TaxID=502181 RepID=UPI001064364C|nr:NACHT domain-containing protein [Actinophytocola oryzae]